MGQILHGSASTTEALRRAIQHSQERVKVLTDRNGVNPNSVSKWKHREPVAGRKTASLCVLECMSVRNAFETLNSAQFQGNTLSDADTECHQTRLRAGFGHAPRAGRCNSCARHAEGMTQTDAASFGIYVRGVVRQFP